MNNTAIEKFKERFEWTKIHAPKAWRPKRGDELAGFYGGRTMKNGAYGQYEVIIVRVPHAGVFMVSGTALIQLIDAAMISEGHAIRVTFSGEKKLDGEKKMKLFELHIAQETPLSDEDIEEVTQ